MFSYDSNFTARPAVDSIDSVTLYVEVLTNYAEKLEGEGRVLEAAEYRDAAEQEWLRAEKMADGAKLDAEIESAFERIHTPLEGEGMTADEFLLSLLVGSVDVEESVR